MATQTIKMRIQFRRDTTENWLLNQGVVPAPGEPCFDLDLHTLKIGDGETTYENLPVIGGENFNIAADGKSITLDGNTLKLMGFDDAQPGAYAVIGEDGNLTWVVPEITVEDLAEEIGDPADAEAGTEATCIYAKLESKADASVIGEVPEGQTLIQMISEAAYDDTALAGKVADAEGEIEALEGKAHEHANKEIIDGITAEKIAAWDAAKQDAIDSVLGYIADEEVNVNYDTLKEVAAWIESDTTASAELVTRVSDLEKVGAEKNVIASVDTTQFNVDENRNLTLLEIAMSKVTGLQDALDGKADIGDVYTKQETLDKIAEKIAEVNGGESAGEVLSQLNSYKETNDARVDTIDSKLTTIEEAAQVNKIEAIKVGNTLLEIVEKTVTIPAGAGLKASDEITVAEDGTLGIGTISWDKITQAEGETVTFDGGGAAG